MSVATLGIRELAVWHGCYDEGWGDLIVPDAYAHPAKFSCGLIRRIFKHGFERGWWAKGDLIGDPFAGIGTGGLIASGLDLRWVGVELEPRFVELAEQCFAARRHEWDVDPVILQGDSRRFAEIVAGYKRQKVCEYGEIVDFFCSSCGTRYHAIPSEQRCPNGCDGYEKYCDAIVTSPPFASMLGSTDSGFLTPCERQKTNPSPSNLGHYGTTPGQIGAMPEGKPKECLPCKHAQIAAQESGGEVDGVKPATVPTSAKACVAAQRLSNTKRTSLRRTSTCLNQTASDRSIHDGEVEMTDGEDSLGEYRSGKRLRGTATDADVAEQMAPSLPTTSKTVQKPVGNGIIASGILKRSVAHATRENITSADENDAPDTYWSAVAQVYEQCQLALKPGGMLVVVVKDYIKGGKRVPLCDQTLDLLQRIGFELVERVRAMLVKETREAGLFGEHVNRKERKSFFRRLAERKGSPRIDWEEVLCVRATA